MPWLLLASPDGGGRATPSLKLKAEEEAGESERETGRDEESNEWK